MESSSSGSGEEWVWAYLDQNENYIFGDGSRYFIVKKVGNITFLEGEYDDKQRKGKFGCDVQPNIDFSSETQGEGC